MALKVAFVAANHSELGSFCLDQHGHSRDPCENLVCRKKHRLAPTNSLSA